MQGETKIQPNKPKNNNNKHNLLKKKKEREKDLCTYAKEKQKSNKNKMKSISSIKTNKLQKRMTGSNAIYSSIRNARGSRKHP